MAANKKSSSSEEEEEEEEPPKKVAKVDKKKSEEQEEVELKIKKPNYDNFVKAGQDNYNGNNKVSVNFHFKLKNVGNVRFLFNFHLFYGCNFCNLGKFL